MSQHIKRLAKERINIIIAHTSSCTVCAIDLDDTINHAACE